MYAVTGANGQLGQRVVTELVSRVGAGQVVALVRNPDKAAGLLPEGVEVRLFDYDRAETLADTLAGMDRLLLISSSEVGKRATQHGAVIDAASAAGVTYIAYTSILHADRNRLLLAEEHRATEAALVASGLPHAVLRNGWYNENYLMGIEATIAHGTVMGAAGKGRISAASRQDYAEAAAAVLADGETATRVFELAGDTAFTMEELAACIAQASGKPVTYLDMTQAEYSAALQAVGLPPMFADILADSSAGAASDVLFDEDRTLSRLIGRATTPITASIRQVLSPA